MKLKETSFAYRFAKWGGWLPWHAPHRNICTLVRCLVQATLKLLFFTALATLVTVAALLVLYVLVYNPLAWLIGLAFNVKLLGLALAMWSAFATVVVMGASIVALRRWRASRRGLPAREPGVVRTYLRSLKDKTCVMVEIE